MHRPSEENKGEQENHVPESSLEVSHIPFTRRSCSAGLPFLCGPCSPVRKRERPPEDRQEGWGLPGSFPDHGTTANADCIPAPPPPRPPAGSTVSPRRLRVRHQQVPTFADHSCSFTSPLNFSIFQTRVLQQVVFSPLFCDGEDSGIFFPWRGCKKGLGLPVRPREEGLRRISRSCAGLRHPAVVAAT